MYSCTLCECIFNSKLVYTLRFHKNSIYIKESYRRASKFYFHGNLLPDLTTTATLERYTAEGDQHFNQIGTEDTCVCHVTQESKQQPSNVSNFFASASLETYCEVLNKLHLAIQNKRLSSRIILAQGNVYPQVVHRTQDHTASLGWE